METQTLNQVQVLVFGQKDYFHFFLFQFTASVSVGHMQGRRLELHMERFHISVICSSNKIRRYFIWMCQNEGAGQETGRQQKGGPRIFIIIYI